MPVNDELLTQADAAVRAMFDRPVTSAEALEAAADFLAGLIEHADFHGYMDPDAGEVSTLFALTMVRAALAARPQPLFVFEGTFDALAANYGWQAHDNRFRWEVYPAVAGSATTTGDDDE